MLQDSKGTKRPDVPGSVAFLLEEKPYLIPNFPGMSFRPARNVCAWAIVVGVAVLFQACKAPTSAITQSWVTDKPLAAPLKKILVVGVAENVAIRSYYEESLVKDLASKNLVAVSSLSGMPSAEKISKEAFERYFRDQSFDGVLITRPEKLEELPRYVPGSPGSEMYSSYYGYYTSAYSKVEDPGGFEYGTLARLETNLFDVASEELVYSCHSNSYVYGNAEQAVKEIARLVTKDLRRAGLIP